MCHEYRSRVWDRAREDDEDETEDDMPAFANEEGSEDVELLTDGGDES
mgnify:CR=1 FL=1